MRMSIMYFPFFKASDSSPLYGFAIRGAYPQPIPASAAEIASLVPQAVSITSVSSGVAPADFLKVDGVVYHGGVDYADFEMNIPL